MSTVNRGRHRVPLSGASAAPRLPIDRAAVGRSTVRRRATGMAAFEAAAALEEARRDLKYPRNYEDLADGDRPFAEVAEWERIAQLLVATGETYDPEADAVVQAELAAEVATSAEAEAELRDLQLEQERQERLHSNGLPERAHMLKALEEAGLLDASGAYGAEGPLVLHDPEDEHALDYLNEYGDWRLVAILQGCDLTPPRDPDAVSVSVRAHSALLRSMARAGTLQGFDAGHAVRLAQAAPDAVIALAAWIEASGRSSR